MQGQVLGTNLFVFQVVKNLLFDFGILVWLLQVIFEDFTEK